MDPENPYIGRIVVLLTPIFAGLAGWIATRAAEWLPGMPDLDEAELTALFVAGGLFAASAVYKWLDNRGKYEQGVALAAEAESLVVASRTGHPPNA